MDLVFECDHSMREHMIAKNQFLVEPNDQNERILESSEVGLISCHDYDSLRKKMLVYGLSEDQLSDMQQLSHVWPRQRDQNLIGSQAQPQSISSHGECATGVSSVHEQFSELQVTIRLSPAIRIV